MVPNAGFWENCFRETYVRAIEAFQTAALKRVASAFSGIAEEADDVAEAEFERLGSSIPVDPDNLPDMGDLADSASELGVEYHDAMSRVRQGVVNLLAVGLHHLFEQQQLSFLGRELARGESGPFQPAEIEKRLRARGVDPRSFECEAKVRELRLAANAIKHGGGRSARELARLRHDLFEDPVLKSLSPATGTAANSQRAVALASSSLTPLAGNGIYTSERDLSEWCAAAISYWKELAAILDGK